MDSYNKCKHKKCNNKALYKDATNKYYCDKHKIKDSYRICDYQVCESKICMEKALYNYENETYALYCSEHKLDGMINVTKSKCENDSIQQISGVKRSRLTYESSVSISESTSISELSDELLSNIYTNNDALYMLPLYEIDIDIDIDIDFI